jgi:hypothetical protein
MYHNTFLWIFINIIISLIIIYICHSIWIYVKDTYSTRKTKDLVNTQVSKYKQIIQELQENKLTNQGSQISEEISKTEIENMDNLLTEFMENELY